MHTFSAALQSVTADGQNIRFDTDPQDYGVCSVIVNDKQVAKFTRNGMLIGVEDVPPPPPAKEADAAKDPHATKDPNAPPAAGATTMASQHQDPPKGKSK